MMIQPMKEELIQAGFEELTLADEVKDAFNNQKGTAVLIVNSVCGCSAGSARPGIIDSIKNEKKPDKFYTVFAGVDREATEAARDLMIGYPPSSPAVALFREGKLVHMIERHQIEGSDAGTLSKTLKSAYNKYCGNKIDESVSIYDSETELDISLAQAVKLIREGKAELYDIREPSEIEIASLSEAKLLDQQMADDIIQNHSKDSILLFLCHHGQRSRQAAKYFKQYQFENSYSVAGGIDAWSREIDSSIPIY